jgi:hypothetical protein
MTPWSAKPGLGTPDGLPFQTIPGAATLWWQARRVVRSVRLPEASAADWAACEEGPCWAGHEPGCPWDAKEQLRQAAIAAARGGAR